MISRYTRPEMARLWTDEHRLGIWLEVEIAVCEALAKRGVIPAEAAREMRAKARVDARRVAEIELEVKHDVIAFVTAAAESIGPAGRYLHLGMTSSDVIDTAFAVQLTHSAHLLLRGLDGLLAAVRKLAETYRDARMIGRTHGVHAEPITFGLKAASWYAEVCRGFERIETACREIATGKLSGAVGTYAHLSPEVEAEVLPRLGLAPETVATQIVPRDRHAAFFSALAIVAASLERIALELRHLQRTEVLEAEEPFTRGQKGSSAMPHKRNPWMAENLCGLARLMRGYAGSALENVALWHERDISHSSVERVIAPDACTVLDFMIARLTGILDRLVVYPERMAENAAWSGELVFSESVLLALVEGGVAREEGYRWVQRCAFAARDEGGSFRELVGLDPDIRKVLDEKHLTAVFDPKRALAHTGAIIDRALAIRPRLPEAPPLLDS
ncbi:MAG: adenylosuccinate lyase [Deltaproteobacteria bacterium]|nr:adenylosuccinate lyase [Deltaproteobacteria bacterium]